MAREDGWIAVGGKTTNAQTLLPSAAYANAAVLFLIKENETI